MKKKIPCRRLESKVSIRKKFGEISPQRAESFGGLEPSRLPGEQLKEALGAMESKPRAGRTPALVGRDVKGCGSVPPALGVPLFGTVAPADGPEPAPRPAKRDHM